MRLIQRSAFDPAELEYGKHIFQQFLLLLVTSLLMLTKLKSVAIIVFSLAYPFFLLHKSHQKQQYFWFAVITIAAADFLWHFHAKRIADPSLSEETLGLSIALILQFVLTFAVTVISIFVSKLPFLDRLKKYGAYFAAVYLGQIIYYALARYFLEQ